MKVNRPIIIMNDQVNEEFLAIIFVYLKFENSIRTGKKLAKQLRIMINRQQAG